MLKDHQDAHGHQFLDCHQTGQAYEAIEREDGYSDVSRSFGHLYLAEYRHRHVIERKAMRYARGRALDMGCGVGRHALCLQDKGPTISRACEPTWFQCRAVWLDKWYNRW